MTPPVDVTGRAHRAVLRDLPPLARYDYQWVRGLLEPTHLPAGLAALLALEASAAALPMTPCLQTWLRLLAAAIGADPVAFRLREALALAVDAREALRERRPDPAGGLPDAADLVRAIVVEGRHAARCAALLARRRPNCLLIRG